MSLHRKPLRSATLATAALAGLCVFGGSSDARADDASFTGKGIAGGALLGAEVVTIGESIFGVHSPWAYGVGAVVGAAGGGVGGFFVGQGSNDGKAPMYMLAGGLALVIPALVLTLNATRFRPEAGATEDTAPVGPPAEPGAPGGSITGGANAPASAPPPPSAPPPAAPAPPQSILDLHRGTWRLGLPVPEVRPVFSVADQRQYGVKSETELRMPVLHVAF